jgi:hypothetical protein
VKFSLSPVWNPALIFTVAPVREGLEGSPTLSALSAITGLPPSVNVALAPPPLSAGKPTLTSIVDVTAADCCDPLATLHEMARVGSAPPLAGSDDVELKVTDSRAAW